MKVETEKLMKVSSFAKAKNTSVQSVYNWINAGVINSVSIDGVAFVIMDEDAEDKIKSK